MAVVVTEMKFKKKVFKISVMTLVLAQRQMLKLAR